MHVNIAKPVNEAANRYGNLLPTSAQRAYAFAYLGWLRNGAEGYEPKRGRITIAQACEIKAAIDAMKLWEHVEQ